MILLIAVFLFLQFDAGPAWWVALGALTVLKVFTTATK